MSEQGPDYRNKIVSRSLAIWLWIICAKIIHGILRAVLLVPMVGEFRSNQIGIYIGSLIILAIAYFTIRWIGAQRLKKTLLVGMICGLRNPVWSLRGGADLGRTSGRIQHCQRWTDASGLADSAVQPDDCLEVA